MKAKRIHEDGFNSTQMMAALRTTPGTEYQRQSTNETWWKKSANAQVKANNVKPTG